MIDGDRVPSLDLRQLKVISALGRGAKGVVFLIKSTEPSSDDGEMFALKAISKASIEKKKKASKDSEYRRVCFEREVLRSFQHPLLPKLRGVMETEKIVGYAIEYCPGRDLNYLRKKQTEKMFSDDIIRFYAAELVLALEYLHGMGIVYRDLKPENVMIQANGHLMLIDYDLSTKLSARTSETRRIVKSPPKSEPAKKKKVVRFYKCCNSGISPEDSVHQEDLEHNSESYQSESDSAEKSNSFVGTEEYVAPEIISGHGHDFAVDWWCLGVVLYEMLYGVTPFRGSNRKETFYRILAKTPELVGEATPLRDLIRKLLEKDPMQRITVEEIKGHDFFQGVDWDLILRMPRPPYIPEMPEGEDMEGNMGIDVEDFVQNIFKVGKNETDKNHNTDENANNGAWVEGLTHNESTEKFLIF